MKSKILLIAILFLFLMTRLYKITEIPASLYWDEVSIGYNAHSIVTTGRDEWGDFLPLHFRAFGEFKLPVYIYSVVLAEKLFGFNEFSVRFPAVLYFGGAIFLTYLLTLKIFKKESAALFSAFFLALSPWTFIFSRTGYEANAGLMFFLLGIYLFLSVNKNKWFTVPSILSFLLSMYSYNGFRILIPLMFPILLYYYFNTLVYRSKDFLKSLIPIGLAIIILFIGIIPIIRLLLYDAGGVRLQTISIQGANIFETFKIFIINYLSHFSPDFLFTGDKNPRSQMPGFGQIYFLDLLLLILGIIYLIKQKKIIYLLPLFMLAIAPIPAAITRETPHALRSIAIVPFLAIISALGLVWIGKKFKFCKYLLPIFIIIYLIQPFAYFETFRKLYKYSSVDWQYGYKQIFINYKEQFRNYDHIFISDHYGQPYIFALYYLKYNPTIFWQEVKLNPVSNWGFSRVAGFDNFLFGKADSVNLPSGKTLVFASLQEVKNTQGLSIVKDLTGPAFYVYEFQK